MKKTIFTLLLLTSTLLGCHNKHKESAMTVPLPPAPKTLERFQEIAVQYDDKLPELYNNISPEERILLYYLYRASLPGNLILADQTHQDANSIIDIFYAIVNNKTKLLSLNIAGFDVPTFIKQAECYFIYVWTNHGQYFEKEHINNKRTPAYLKLDLLTPQNLITVLNALEYPNAKQTISVLEKSLFDQKDDPTATIQDDIENSAVNFYSADFTAKDYLTLPANECSKLNNYFFVSHENGKRIPQTQAYCINGRCGKELAVACHWLSKAHEHAQKNPLFFDQHLIKSIELLNVFFQTGNEEIFKNHCIEWLKSASRISYTLGFIETYKDPKGIRGTFQGDATIKSIDLSKLNAILPDIERQLPFPQEFKRENIDTLPNASINCKVFGTGDLGPLFITAAYCLPNYTDMRATHGSKQVMYTNTKQLAALINPAGYRTLFFTQARGQWLKDNAPDFTILDDIWDIHCILHETIGHGSGKSEGEIPAGYDSTLEELRAEIISLYVSLVHLDQLVTIGFLQKWAKILSHQELTDWIIYTMLHDGLRRLLVQTDNATEVSGAHAQADWTIYTYLLNHDCFTPVEQQINFDGTQKTVIDVANIDTPKTIKIVTELMQEVQRIKSTGDGQAAKKLIDGCCNKLKNPQYITILKDNLHTLVGDLKVSAILSPLFTTVKDSSDATKIIDIQATWPQNIVQLAQYEREHELSTAE